MPSHPTEILRIRLQCDENAPGHARRAVARLDAIANVKDDAVLAASELAAHAVTTAGAEPDEQIELCAQLLPDGVVIGIRNERRRRSPPQPTLAAPRRLSAILRLRVLEAIGRRWGTDGDLRPSLWVELAL